MANLVDTFIPKSNLTNSESTLFSNSEDLPKDKPSLFDSLLKSSIESVESKNSSTTLQTTQTKNLEQNSLSQSNNLSQVNSSQTKTVETAETKSLLNNSNVQSNILDTSSVDTQILDENEQNKTIEKVIKDSQIENSDTLVEKEIEEKSTKNENSSVKDMEKNIQNSKNSLLDRLILEVKTSSVEKNDLISQIENSDKSMDKIIDFTNSLEESIDELNSKNLSNKNEQKIEIITTNTTIKDDGTVVEILQKESIIKELATNIETKNIEVITKDITTNTVLIDEQINQNSVVASVETEENITKLQNSTTTISEELAQQTIKIEEEIKQNPQNNNQEKNQKLSLMDQLILSNSKQEIKEQTTKVENIVDQNIDNKQQKQVASNIYLAEQKNSLNNQLLFNKNEAINILEKGSSIEDIKNSANILDLDISEVEVENATLKDTINNLKDLKASDIDKLDKKTILDYLLNEKNIRSLDVKNLITNSIEASKALFSNTLTIKEDTVIDVQTNLAQSIQTKIIGAKQQVSSMMSDIARQMYENYKPPVTAFRMVLNPVDLGSISVLMKQNGANGLTISMSVSSIATLDLLMENQNMLRNSLLKSFSDGSNFNLDFSQGQDGSQGGSSNNQKREEKNQNTQDILRMKDENRDYEEKNDYM